MQCVAQSTPMVATGLVVLRRRSLAAFLKGSLAGRLLGFDEPEGPVCHRPSHGVLAPEP
jgi:hypothetical protein